MRWHHTALVFLVIVCLAAASHAEETIADSAELFIKDWVASFNKYDPEMTSAFYDRSKETEVITSSGFRFRGYEAIQKSFREAQEEVRFLNSSAEEIQTRILGNTALVTFEHVYKIQILADDSHWQVHVRTTSVLHRMENKWKIVLEHSSAIRGVERMTRIEDW